jgi:ABC-2 type transport system ATP-binding protein
MASAPMAMPEEEHVVIRAEQLGIRYSLRLTKKQTVRDSVIRRVKRVGDPDFWALRDVSFSMVHGESLGVIGPNGAGKSTLLQVLAGILMPSEGTIQVDGHISSLLTLGVGFDEELSGVDNIRLAGAFMGIDHKVMEGRVPSIIEYAEIGQFIDAPIKTYSAGMRARLGFAIATSVEPDILLLDEVLATGDAAFREKSKARVLELVREAKAIVLVTHDMEWVTEYCNRAMLIEQGRIVMQGDPAEVVAVHREHMASRKAQDREKGVLQLRTSRR